MTVIVVNGAPADYGAPASLALDRPARTVEALPLDAVRSRSK